MTEVLVVESIDDILANISYLEQIRQDSTHVHNEAYKRLISRARNFFAYPIHDGFGFAPSRFSGYKNNTFEINAEDPGHGGETDRAISSVVGYDREENKNLDDEFKKFCHLQNIQLVGIKRKYWDYNSLPDELKKKVESLPK